MSINGIGNNFNLNDLNPGRKTVRSEKEEKSSDPKEAIDRSTQQVNKILIEMNLSIRVEAKTDFGTQSAIKNLPEAEGIDLSQFEYNGKPVTELSQQEAKDLVSADGFFGVEQTAGRIFDFAIKMAGNDLERLKMARAAVQKGFEDAAAAFGGSLPDISHDTIGRALEQIDSRISELGGSLVSIKA